MKALLKIISSPWVMAAASLALGAEFISLMPAGSENAFARWMDFLFKSLTGLLLYFTLMLNIALSTLRIVLTKMKANDMQEEAVRAMDAVLEVPMPAKDPIILISEWAGAWGPPVEVSAGAEGAEGGLSSQAGRFSFVPGLVMRAGLLLFMVAVLVGSFVKRADEAVMHVGDVRDFFGQQVRLDELQSGLPEEFLKLKGKSVLLLNPEAVLSSKAGVVNASGGFPVRVGGLYFRVVDAGIAQGFSIALSGRTGHVLADLDVLPPGIKDQVQLPGGAGTVQISLHPEKTIDKGLIKGEVFNLRQPLYRIVLKQAQVQDDSPLEISAGPGEITVGPGGAFKVKGREVVLGQSQYFARVLCVSDASLPWAMAGLVVFLAGLCLMPIRFLWYEKRLCVLIQLQNDRVLLGYSEEFFKKWGIQKFHWHAASLLPSTLLPSTPLPSVAEPDKDKADPAQ